MQYWIVTKYQILAWFQRITHFNIQTSFDKSGFLYISINLSVSLILLQSLQGAPVRLSVCACVRVCEPAGGEDWSALLKWWEQVQFVSCSACQWLLELQGWWNCSCRYLKAVVIHLKMLWYNPFNFLFLAAITLSNKNLSKQCSLVI